MSSLAATRTIPRQRLLSISQGKHTILSLITSLLINILKLPERLNDVDIVLRPDNNMFRTLMETVIQHLQRFEYMAPILPLIVQPLIQHIHNFEEIG